MKNKLNKIFLALFSVFLLVGGGIFSACQKEQPQATIEVSSQDFVADDYIEIDLGSQERTATVTAKVTGISAGVVSVNNDHRDIIATSAVYDSASESTSITIVGKSEGDAQLVLKSHGNGEKVIRVYVYSDITSLDQTDSEKDRYVVRGQANTLYPDRLLKFGSREGGESNRKDVAWSLKTVDSNLSLEGNVLTVGEEYQSSNSNATVELYADSIYVDKRATVVLDVISPIPDYPTYISRTSDAQGDVLTESGTSFNLVKNDDSNEESKLFARLVVPVATQLKVTPKVYSASGVEVTDKLDILLFNSRTLSGASELIYTITAKSHIVMPEDLTVCFDVAYEKYSYAKESTRFVVSLVDVIDRIDVKSNGASITKGDTINVYDYYNNDSSYQFGHPFLVSLGPDTVTNNLAKYYVDITVPTGTAVNGMVILSNQYGSPIRFGERLTSTALGDTYRSEAIDNKTTVYLIAGNSFTNGDELVCTFISKQTERVNLSIKIRLYNSPKENFDIESGDFEYYLSTNKYDSKIIEVTSTALMGIDKAGVKLNFVENEKIKLTDYKFDTESGKISFKVANSVLNINKDDAMLRVNVEHSNGFVSKQDIAIYPFIPLKNAKVDYKGQSTTAVSKTQYAKQEFYNAATEIEGMGDTTLTQLIMKAGNSVEMSFYSNCDADISFKLVADVDFEEVETEQEKLDILIAAMDMIENGTTLIANPLKNAGVLSMPSNAEKYYALVTFSGYDEQHNEITIYRYFYLEGYVSPTRLTPNSGDERVELFAEDSVSADERDLSRQRVTIKYRNDNKAVTYWRGQKDGQNLVEVASTWISGENTYWEYDHDSFVCTDSLISFEIVAKTTGGREVVSSQAVISYSVFNTIYHAQIDISIKNAQRVEKIVYTNKNPDDGIIYLDINSTIESDRNAVILTSVLPSNAYNKDLEYIFVADDGTLADLVTVNSLGVVSFKNATRVGGTGSIYVLPKDAIRTTNGVKGIKYYKDGDDNQHSINLLDIGAKYNELCSNNYFFEGAVDLATNSREKIYYKDVVIKIPIIVADGASEETAIRIYGTSQLASIDPSLHYELMNSLIIGSDWQPISITSGSLRGHDSDVTIMFNGSASLFETIGANAKVKDLTLIGSVNGNGMLAETNNGLVENIKVTIYSDENAVVKIPMVNGSGYVGGLVGINNGEIKNSAVEGAKIISGNTETDFAGGIAGHNTGIISGSRVEFYRIAADSVNTFTGYYVGGIVGYLSAGGEIESSYAYNYSSIYPLSGAKLGAFAGKALSGAAGTVSKIYNTFAILVDEASQGNIVSVGENGEEKIDAHGDPYTANTARIYDAYWGYGSSKEDFTDSSYWVAAGNESFKSYVRSGEKHLAFYQAEAFSSDDMNALKVQDIYDSENDITKAVRIDNDNGILFISALKDSSVLTDSERAYLRAYNTISIADLLELSDTSKVVISSSSKNVDVEGGNIVLLDKVGEVKIAVSSKFDFSCSREFTFKVVYALDQFTVWHDEVETLGFTLQEGRTSTMSFTIKDSIYIGNSGVAHDIKLEDFLIISSIEQVEKDGVNVLDGKVALNTNGMSATILAASGTKDALAECRKEYFNIHVAISVEGLDKSHNSKIIEKTKKTLQIYPTKGSQTIKLTTEALNIEPAYQSKFNVTLVTDDSADELLLSLKLGDVSLVKTDNVYSLNGENRIIINATRGSNDGKKKEFVYEITVSVHDDYKHKINSTEQYTLSLASKTGTADNEGREVVINLSTQMINNIDMTNYQMGSTNYKDGRVYYSHNGTSLSVISPGKTTIMQVSIDPTFAHYEYMTLTYKNTDGASMGITALATASDGYETDGTALQVERGVRLERNTDGVFFFMLYAAQNISVDTTFNVVATFYGKDGNPVITPSIFDLYISYLPEAEITVNGDISALIAKGGSLDIEMMLKVDQEIESISATNVKGISISPRSSWIVENNGNGTKTIKAKLYAGLNAGILQGESTTPANGEFELTAVVSRVFNGTREEKRSSAYVTVVDLLPESAEVKNATEKNGSETKVLDSYIGIPIVVDFDYAFNPNEYAYDHASEDEIKLNKELSTARADFQNYKYYYDDKTGFAINYNESVIVPIYKRIKIGNQTANFVRSSENEHVWIFNYTKFRLSYNEETNLMTVLGLSSTASPVTLTLVDEISVESSGKAIKYTIETPFAIDVVTYSDPDLPLIIRDETDFLKVKDEGTAQNYILLNDITLTNYTPFAANMFKVLDGNGYAINIESFNMEGSGTLNLALFTSIPSTSTIKNLKVNYYNGGNINVDTTSSGYSTINVAGVAINNAGIITNTQVVAYKNQDSKLTNNGQLGLQVNLLRGSTPYYIDDNASVKAQIAGFVLSNTGSITNSKVGGESIIVIDEHEESNYNYTYYQNQTLEQFVLSGQGDMAGFVLSNAGSISASGASNIQITNLSTSTKTMTAGFVVTNNASIRMAYAEGTKDENEVTQYHLTGSTISARGTVAGFVVSNGMNGIIENAYSNIFISNSNESQSRTSAGFVYKNEGEIAASYSASKVEKANILQTNFSGVDGNGNSRNLGKIELSYYYIGDYADDSSQDIQGAIENQASRVNKDAVDSENSYYGFVFSSSSSTRDGIWEVDAEGRGGVKLICRNEITISHRYYQAIAEDEYVLPYSILKDKTNTAGAEYNTALGNECNPILISSANEFKEAMGESKSIYVQKFYNKDKVFGSYRFVSNITLADLNDELGNAEVSSIDKVFSGKIDGNGFTINSISIKSSNYSVGLFGEINGGIVKNIGLEVDNITASDSYTVGALTGLAKNAIISNISFTQKSLSEGTSGKGVLGRNITGGIIGSVFGDSYITGLSSKDAIVQSSYYDSPSSGEAERVDTYLSEFDSKVLREYESQSRARFFSNDGIGELSFAGGVIGYSDTYMPNEYSSAGYVFGQNLVDSQYALKKLSTSGTIDVRGEVVGGIIGFTGFNTKAKDISVVISKGDGKSNNILSYNGFAGAVVGYANGQFHQVYAEHDKTTQNKIETSTNSYYAGGVDSVERGDLELFKFKEASAASYEYKPVYVGGLMGVIGSGAITVSYSKINAINYTENGNAGGIAGLVTSSTRYDISVEALGVKAATTLYLGEVYASGDVYAESNFAGLFGKLHNNNVKLTLMSVNAVNHYGIVGNATKYANVYAIASNANESNVNVYPAAEATDGVSQAQINNARSFGYMSDYNAKDGSIKVIPYEDYGVVDKDFYFRITAVSAFTSAENGYTETTSAFINSGAWDADNWTHKITDLYPTINLVNQLNYVYLDQYNIVSVISKMQNSSIEVRVRGRVSANEDQYGNVDLRDVLKDGSITNFSGKLVGAIDGTWGINFGPVDLIQDGNGEIERGYPGIIIDNTLFESTGSGVQISTLNIIVKKDEKKVDPVGTGATDISVEGGLISKQEVIRAKFESVALYINNKVNVKTVEKSAELNGGLLVPSAQSSSFKSVSFNFYNQSTITIEGSSSTQENPVTNIGLLAGSIIQNSKYESVKIQDITIRQASSPSESTNDFVVLHADIATAANVGLYVGSITNSSESDQVAGVVLTAKAPEVWKNSTVETDRGVYSMIEIFAVGSSKVDLNFGGYYGSVTARQTTLTFTKDKPYTQRLTLANGVETASLNEGGLIGVADLQGLTFLALSDAGGKKIIQTDLRFAKSQGTANIGLMFGRVAGSFTIENTQGGVEGKIYDITDVGIQIVANAIGGIVGENDATLLIKDLDLSLITYKTSGDKCLSIKESNSTYEDNEIGVGGFIGKNNAEIRNPSGEIKLNKDGENIALSGNSIRYGDFIGRNFSTVELHNFASNADVSMKASQSLCIGGIIGDSNISSMSRHNVDISVNGESKNTISVMSRYNIYLSDSVESSFGGAIGYAQGSMKINGIIFGGVFKFSASSGKNVVGGVIGSSANINSLTVTNNKIYGDAIYSIEGQITEYYFGGVIGNIDSGTTPTITGNIIAFTNNNPRANYATRVNAIVGNNDAIGVDNYYCSQLVLATNDHATDLGYYIGVEGYGGDKKTTMEKTIIEMFGSDITNGLPDGHKLNPITNGSVPVVTTDEGKKQNLNGVTYYTTKYPSIADNGGEKILENAAFIGDFKDITSTDGRTPVDVVGKNAFVSGVVVSNNVPDTSTATFTGNVGGIANELRDGIIFACKSTGTLSIGGTATVNVGGIVGLMANGRIAECYSSVNVIYRAKTGGTAAGIAVTSDESVVNFIEKSYSTGEVGSYISANLYAFTNGADTYVNDSYTISHISAKDHTTSGESTGTLGIFGKATCINCRYDKDAMECTFAGGLTSGLYGGGPKPVDTVINKRYDTNTFDPGERLGQGWVADMNNNFGYMRRNFKAFEVSSFVEVTENGNEVKYYLIPNLTKFLQMKNDETNYKLTRDIDISKTSKANDYSTKNLGNQGVFDGDGHTIRNNKVMLFSSVGTLKNLRVEGYMSGDTGITGPAVVADNVNSAENVIATGLLKGIANGGCVGGLFKTAVVSIKNCKNYVKIDVTTTDGGTDWMAVGGIVGYMPANSDAVEIKNCFNYAPINVANHAYVDVGGIIGHAGETYNENKVTIRYCGNENTVFNGYTNTIGEDGKDAHTGTYKAAGIVGRLSKGSVSNCYNTGMIKAGNKNLNPDKGNGTAYAAGIVAFNEVVSETNITSCYNLGYIEALGSHKNAEISYKMDISSSGYTGGGYSSYARLYNLKYNSTKIVNVAANAICSINYKAASSGNNYKAEIYNNGLHGEYDLAQYLTGFNSKDKYLFIELPENSVMKDYKSNGIYITSNVELMYNDVDRLGAPTSIYLKCIRTIYYGKENSSVYRKQVRYTNPITVESLYSYEEASLEAKHNTTIDFSQIRPADSTAETQPTNVSIGGRSYAFVKDSGELKFTLNTAYNQGLIKIDNIDGTAIESLVNAGYDMFTITNAADNISYKIDSTNKNKVKLTYKGTSTDVNFGSTYTFNGVEYVVTKKTTDETDEVVLTHNETVNGESTPTAIYSGTDGTINMLDKKPIFGSSKVVNDSAGNCYLEVQYYYDESIAGRNFTYTISASRSSDSKTLNVDSSNVYINGNTVEIRLYDQYQLVDGKTITVNAKYKEDETEKTAEYKFTSKREGDIQKLIYTCKSGETAATVAARLNGNTVVINTNDGKISGTETGIVSSTYQPVEKSFTKGETTRKYYYNNETDDIAVRYSNVSLYYKAGTENEKVTNPCFDTPVQVVKNNAYTETDGVYTNLTLTYNVYGKLRSFYVGVNDVNFVRTSDGDTATNQSNTYNIGTAGSNSTEYYAGTLTQGDLSINIKVYIISADYDADKNITSIKVRYKYDQHQQVGTTYEKIYLAGRYDNYNNDINSNVVNGNGEPYVPETYQIVVTSDGIQFTKTYKKSSAVIYGNGNSKHKDQNEIRITYDERMAEVYYKLESVTISKPSGAQAVMVSHNGNNYEAITSEKTYELLNDHGGDTFKTYIPGNTFNFSTDIANDNDDSLINPSAGVYERKLILAEMLNTGTVNINGDYVNYSIESSDNTVKFSYVASTQRASAGGSVEYKDKTYTVARIDASGFVLSYNGANYSLGATGQITIGGNKFDYELQSTLVQFKFYNENSVTVGDNYTFKDTAYEVTIKDGTIVLTHYEEDVHGESTSTATYNGIAGQKEIQGSEGMIVIGDKTYDYIIRVDEGGEYLCDIYGETSKKTGETITLDSKSYTIIISTDLVYGEITLKSGSNSYQGTDGIIQVAGSSIGYELGTGNVSFNYTDDSGDHNVMVELTNNVGSFTYNGTTYTVTRNVKTSLSAGTDGKVIGIEILNGETLKHYQELQVNYSKPAGDAQRTISLMYNVGSATFEYSSYIDTIKVSTGASNSITTVYKDGGAVANNGLTSSITTAGGKVTVNLLQSRESAIYTVTADYEVLSAEQSATCEAATSTASRAASATTKVTYSGIVLTSDIDLGVLKDAQSIGTILKGEGYIINYFTDSQTTLFGGVSKEVADLRVAGTVASTINNYASTSLFSNSIQANVTNLSVYGSLSPSTHTFKGALVGFNEKYNAKLTNINNFASYSFYFNDYDWLASLQFGTYVIYENRVSEIDGVNTYGTIIGANGAKGRLEIGSSYYAPGGQSICLIRINSLTRSGLVCNNYGIIKSGDGGNGAIPDFDRYEKETRFDSLSADEATLSFGSDDVKTKTQGGTAGAINVYMDKLGVGKGNVKNTTGIVITGSDGKESFDGNTAWGGVNLNKYYWQKKKNGTSVNIFGCEFNNVYLNKTIKTEDKESITVSGVIDLDVADIPNPKIEWTNENFFVKYGTFNSWGRAPGKINKVIAEPTTKGKITWMEIQFNSDVVGAVTRRNTWMWFYVTESIQSATCNGNVICKSSSSIGYGSNNTVSLEGSISMKSTAEASETTGN